MVQWQVCNPTYPLAILVRVSSVLTEMFRDITQSVHEDSALLHQMGPIYLLSNPNQPIHFIISDRKVS